MVILQYKPKRKADKHLCLLGKGIVFDSGGICLKPAQDMWTMKADMSGAAACLYAMKALALRKPAFPVTAILCLAENLPDSRAARPGDIFRAANGKSVHVENTDAEGRLVLSDGLCMAGRLKATHIVDLATLTGACVIALGEKIAGLMGNNRGLIDKLMKASEITGENLWPLPLPEFYRENLDIYCADINNVGVNRNGGALNGGIFLKEFVPEGAAWAHLDIAGPAFFEKKWKYYAEGATGFGVRLLVELMKIL
jgi:leucyl aminopeptidase